jgi:hypothetical protein
MSAPFFEPALLNILDSYPSTSLEWRTAVDQISEHIKNSENTLRALSLDSRNFSVPVSEGTFLLQSHGGSELLRLCWTSDASSSAKPVIELPLTERLKAYRSLPALFDELGRSTIVSEADKKAEKIASKSILEILRDSFDQVKINAQASQGLEKILLELKRLRQSVPKDEADLRSKASWFKHLASLLLSSDLFLEVLKKAKAQLPQIWSQLTFKQKLKFGAMAPIIGAGVHLGAIGIAGGGSAVGVPVVLVILLMLLLNHSLVDFLDYIIARLSLSVKNQPSPDVVSKVFEELLNETIMNVFGRQHDVGKAEKVTAVPFDTEVDPRTFESIAVAAIAKKYGGVGYVTRYSSDGGIDGYIVCAAEKRVILVQAKHYSRKVGFLDATQYLGTFFYWKRALESKFPFPISHLVLACSTDFSIEAKKVAEAFPEELVFEQV